MAWIINPTINVRLMIHAMPAHCANRAKVSMSDVTRATSTPR